MTETAIFYERQAHGLGAEFLDDVQRAIDRLRDNPKLGQLVVNELRRSLLSRFPFALIYTIEPESLLIVAVAHSAVVHTIGENELTANQSIQRTCGR